jgi:hypothetical protein
VGPLSVATSASTYIPLLSTRWHKPRDRVNSRSVVGPVGVKSACSKKDVASLSACEGTFEFDFCINATLEITEVSFPFDNDMLVRCSVSVS